MVFKMCNGISCSLFSVKELDVFVHKIISSYNHINFFGHPVPHITSEPGDWGGN